MVGNAEILVNAGPREFALRELGAGDYFSKYSLTNITVA